MNREKIIEVKDLSISFESMEWEPSFIITYNLNTKKKIINNENTVDFDW